MTATIVDILQSLRRGKAAPAIAEFFEIPEAAVQEVWNNLFDCAIEAATIYPADASLSPDAGKMVSASVVVPEFAPNAPIRMPDPTKGGRPHRSDPPPTGRPRGGRPMPSHNSDPSKMSPLHQQMLEMMKAGVGTMDISRKLNVSSATVSTRRRRFEDAGLIPVSAHRKIA
ncbi:helix-turn-helix domain containing protein [Wolbachia endosymbiont of Drosophila nikananu]|uniref:helix-turn-helix domain-containing protein n=1 Tax=Wolbachia endosymbiont of Drosophila nikananu TaxID=375550 RepID=UPI0023A9C898|nr:helix-turn-helix domain-containing protein [Wolbachia endosymbiont of Drosophila nikananu]MDE5061300.1 helix-turn-helix domain containing protein [Wolbachia endosymbiont of Drosophila nikananu]